MYFTRFLVCVTMYCRFMCLAPIQLPTIDHATIYKLGFDRQLIETKVFNMVRIARLTPLREADTIGM